MLDIQRLFANMHANSALLSVTLLSGYHPGSMARATLQSSAASKFAIQQSDIWELYSSIG